MRSGSAPRALRANWQIQMRRCHNARRGIKLHSHEGNTCRMSVMAEDVFQMFFVANEGRRGNSAGSPFHIGTGRPKCTYF